MGAGSLPLSARAIPNHDYVQIIYETHDERFPADHAEYTGWSGSYEDQLPANHPINEETGT